MASVPTPEYKPFIPSTANVAEFTVRAVVMGALLGMIFGASSLYLVLKVGLTVSASIPVAVIAITLFRLFSKSGGRDSTILETISCKPPARRVNRLPSVSASPCRRS